MWPRLLQKLSLRLTTIVALNFRSLKKKLINNIIYISDILSVIVIIDPNAILKPRDVRMFKVDFWSHQ